MSDIGFALFDTAIGRCAIAWNDVGVVRLQLPERDDDAALRRILVRHPEASEEAPPEPVRQAMALIETLLQGKESDLSVIALDMTGVGEFDAKVYAIARTIAPGATMSYGAIARTLGGQSFSREVGQALGRNPFAIIVPCHRVVAAGGKHGGFSAHGGVDTKLRLLTIEAALSGAPRSLFSGDPAFRFAGKPAPQGRR